MAEVQPLKFTIQRSDEPILTALKDALGTYRRSDNTRAGLTIAAPPQCPPETVGGGRIITGKVK